VRITTGIMKVALIVGLIAIATFGIGLPAMAQDGPTPPELGDPDITADPVVPHGGYGPTTSYCLQCHQVHYDRATLDAPGEYALMAESSVTATCATCHGFEGGAPTGAEDPDFGGSIGTTSTRAVYTQAEPVHVIGAGFGTVGRNAGWDFYTWAGTGSDPNTRGPEAPSGTAGSAGVASYYNGGLYCGSCHTPHGEFGQLINSKWAVTSADQNNSGGTDPVTAVPWQNNTRIWWEDPTPTGAGIPVNADPTNPWKQVYLMFDGTAGAWFVSELSNGAGGWEWAQVLDAEDQLVSLYGYKLLTSSPNHQYPVRNAAGQYLQVDGTTYGATPPVGLYSDAPFAGGALVQDPGAPNFLTHRVIATVDTNAVPPGDNFIDVALPSATATVPTIPFKIRIDDEIMMVTDSAPAGGVYYVWTVTRAVEPVEPEVPCRPWGPVYNSDGTTQFDLCTEATHAAGAEILAVPTMLVNETTNLSVAPTLGVTPWVNSSSSGNSGGLKPRSTYTGTSRVGIPFHIKVDSEMMSVLWRTRYTGTANGCDSSSVRCYLYTVGRALDKTSGVAHAANTTFYVQSGVNRNSVRSWGVDRYSGDMSSFCGSCHSGPVDVKFGGQYHSHPTGCAECHGNSITSGDDFPHSSDNPLMLQALPDGLCVNCHVAGTLP